MPRMLAFGGDGRKRSGGQHQKSCTALAAAQALISTSNPGDIFLRVHRLDSREFHSSSRCIHPQIVLKTPEGHDIYAGAPGRVFIRDLGA